MGDKAWKVFEREVAKALGSVRTGPRGHNLPDVVHDVLAAECKYQKRLSLRTQDWHQTKENARGRIPVLFLKERGTGERRVVMDYTDWLKLFAQIVQQRGDNARE